VKTEKEVRDQVRAIRERIRELSGYWIGEAAAAIYALEWVNGKRQAPPSADIGSAGGEHEKIAASLLKLAEEGIASAAGKKPGSGKRKAEKEKKPKASAKKK
jgi:hypothetical protein